jgi:hypothetical protein
VPCPLAEWARMFDNRKRRQLMLTPILNWPVTVHDLTPPEGAESRQLITTPRVSTVFLGMDHNYTGLGPPLVFETMVFAKDSPGDQTEQRHWRWWGAIENHHKAVQRFKRWRRNKKRDMDRKRTAARRRKWTASASGFTIVPSSPGELPTPSALSSESASD